MFQVSEHAQYQKHETLSHKWNEAVINVKESALTGEIVRHGNCLSWITLTVKLDIDKTQCRCLQTRAVYRVDEMGRYERPPVVSTTSGAEVNEWKLMEAKEVEINKNIVILVV